MTFDGELFFSDAGDATAALERVRRLMATDEAHSTRRLPDPPEAFLDVEADRMTVRLEATGRERLWFILSSLAELLALRADTGCIRARHDLLAGPPRLFDAEHIQPRDDRSRG